MAKAETATHICKFNIKKDRETAVFVDVTKPMAEDWLMHHNNINRGMKTNLWNRYSRDRVNNKWLTTHQAGAFDWNGQAIDGQHRYRMIVETGLTTRMLIVTGLDPRVREVTDIGAKRTPADVLQISGRLDANMRNVAVVRQMMNGLGKRASVPEIIDAYDIYKDAAQTAMAFFPQQNVKNKTISPVIGVLARASYTEDHEKLEEFATLLIEGLGDKSRKGHKSVALLARFLESLHHRGEGMSKTIYGFTEASLAAFLANEALPELFIPEEELFALPEKIKRSRSKLKIVEAMAKSA